MTKKKPKATLDNEFSFIEYRLDMIKQYWAKLTDGADYMNKAVLVEYDETVGLDVEDSEQINATNTTRTVNEMGMLVGENSERIILMHSWAGVLNLNTECKVTSINKAIITEFKILDGVHFGSNEPQIKI